MNFVLSYFIFIQTISIFCNTFKLNCLFSTFSWPITHERIRYSSDYLVEAYSLLLETGHRWSNNNHTDKKKRKEKLNQQYSIITTDHILIWKSRGGILAFLTLYTHIISLDILPLSTTNKSSSKKDSLNFPQGSSGMTNWTLLIIHEKFYFKNKYFHCFIMEWIHEVRVYKILLHRI